MLAVLDPWVGVLTEQRLAQRLEPQTAMSAAALVFVFAAGQAALIIGAASWPSASASPSANAVRGGRGAEGGARQSGGERRPYAPALARRAPVAGSAARPGSGHRPQPSDHDGRRCERRGRRPAGLRQRRRDPTSGRRLSPSRLHRAPRGSLTMIRLSALAADPGPARRPRPWPSCRNPAPATRASMWSSTIRRRWSSCAWPLGYQPAVEFDPAERSRTSPSAIPSAGRSRRTDAPTCCSSSRWRRGRSPT